MRDMAPPSASDAQVDADAARAVEEPSREASPGADARDRPGRRGLMSLRRSPLTRKIVTFNLIALNILVAGILYLNSSRDSLVIQRAVSLVSEAELIADVVEVRLADATADQLVAQEWAAIGSLLQELDLRDGIEIFLYDREGALVAHAEGRLAADEIAGTEAETSFLADALTGMRGWFATLLAPENSAPSLPLSEKIKPLIGQSLERGTQITNEMDGAGGALFAVATPVVLADGPVAVIGVATAAGEIDSLVGSERARVLQMFVIAALVSVGLSLVLASAIANPLAELAAAVELGRERNARQMNPVRIRIPDLTSRADEIGRLSGALRGMISALYNRIDGNEQFAADVAHEIKNPLASLRSAVGTLRMIKRADQREKLLDVIDHDVRRLDRLVSDISNASRLDSELVKQEQEAFDLLRMLDRIGQHFGNEARSKGIDFITDLPVEPISIYGLEDRLAQVFVNLIANAVSFCDAGDAIRIWARRKESRILIVVEDTGPGVPDEALSKIFRRFYSQRPEEHFGNNSGLGLAISKQIVEAHGGVIWAENIRPTEADITSEPLGARFVVGLPV